MSYTFRRWLSRQNRPSQWHGTVGTLHGPSALHNAAKRITTHWDSPHELLQHLGANDDWYQALTDDAREQYNRAFREAIEPRKGPNRSDPFDRTLWARHIGEHQYLFSAWADRLDVYRVPEDTAPQLIHSYPKEPTHGR